MERVQGAMLSTVVVLAGLVSLAATGAKTPEAGLAGSVRILHADRRSFTRERVDLSLVAEEAAETLLPLAEKRGLSIETSGDPTPTVGSHALLLQLSTNLVHNAITHNLPERSE